MPSSFRLWFGMLFLRISSVFLVRSWFVPDEVYQSTEVAHFYVFNKGLISWEWFAALRSVLHPSLIGIFYWLFNFFGCDSQFNISQAPRLLHSVLFSIGDISFYVMCNRLLPRRVATYSFLCYLSSWFIFYCAPRTLSNSLETALTLLALNWYPFTPVHLDNGRVWPYMSLGLLTIVMRPTAGLLWLVFGAAHIFASKQPVRLILFTVLPSMIPVATFAVLADIVMYGRITFSMWNFLSFNVLEGGSAHFGVHPWYWYITEGLPSVLTIQLLPIVIGVFLSRDVTYVPLIASIFYIVFHSFLPHKEQRFLLPIIPLLCIYAGFMWQSRHISRMKRLLFEVMIVLNICVALYTGLRHQIGPYRAADLIIEKSTGNDSLLALMPCFSLPGHSYFHYSLSEIRQLDCSPDLTGSRSLDEADAFFADPIVWLKDNSVQRFSFIVLYEKLYLLLADKFSNLLFNPCGRVFHADFLTSSRQDNHIIVLCKT